MSIGVPVRLRQVEQPPEERLGQHRVPGYHLNGTEHDLRLVPARAQLLDEGVA